jgi:hypothetical protein
MATVSDKGYREMDKTVPLEEHERVLQQLRQAEEAVSRYRHWYSRGELFKRVGYKLKVLALVAIGLYVVWVGLFRGCAFGVTARRNAEREAMTYATRRYGTTPSAVWCEYLAPGDKMQCYARFANTGASSIVQFYCDDDNASSNDGCVAATSNNSNGQSTTTQH